MNSLEDVRHEVWLAERAAQEERDYYFFLQRHPEVSPCEANHRIFSEFISNDGSLMTLEMLEESLPHLLGSLALRSADQVKKDAQNAFATEQKALLDEASSLLASWTDAARADRLKQLARMPLAQLRIEVQNLKDAERLKTLSRKDLKLVVREEYSAAHSGSTGPQSSALPAKITARVIKQSSPAQIRELQKQYGSEAINARLAGRG